MRRLLVCTAHFVLRICIELAVEECFVPSAMDHPGAVDIAVSATCEVLHAEII